MECRTESQISVFTQVFLVCGLFQYTGIDFLIFLFVCVFFNVRNSNKREVPKNNPPKHNGIMYFTNITPSVKSADSPVYFDIPYLNK